MFQLFKYNLFLLCFSAAGFASPAKNLDSNKLAGMVKITNHYGFKRVEEIISIQRNHFPAIGNGLFPQIIQNGKDVIYQMIDNDSDGQWDEILCKVSLKPHSSDILYIYTTENKPDFPNQTNTRLSLKSKTETPTPEILVETRQRGFRQNISDPYYQMEGPGIENDKVAFRCFFDYRNGKDIYGKTTDQMILDQIGLKGSWHEKQPWGMDILKVGESLGAGGLGITENHRLYRLGDADLTEYKSMYRGPLQARLSLTFKGWDTGTTKTDGSENMSMNAGDYFYRNDVAFLNLAGRKLAPGLACFGDYKVQFKKHNRRLSSVSTYGYQAEGTSTSLGLAIMFSTKNYLSVKKTGGTGDLSNTVYAILNHSKNPTTLYFFACWERSDPQFESRKGFDRYLQQAARRLAYPIEIHLIK